MPANTTTHYTDATVRRGPLTLRGRVTVTPVAIYVVGHHVATGDKVSTYLDPTGVSVEVHG